MKGGVRISDSKPKREQNEGRNCFKCGGLGHFKNSCPTQAYCVVCGTDSHSNETCFSQKSRVNKSYAKGENSKTKRRKSKA